jgi:hypothetical protein
MDLKKVVSEDFFRFIVNTVPNLRVTAGDFVTTCVTISFLRRILSFIDINNIGGNGRGLFQVTVQLSEPL